MLNTFLYYMNQDHKMQLRSRMQSGWNYEETLMVPMIEPVYEQIHKSKTLPLVEHQCKEPFDHFKENPKIIFHPNSVEFPNLIKVSIYATINPVLIFP